jgi:DNA-binding beta-propeller fold protein YncE
MRRLVTAVATVAAIIALAALPSGVAAASSSGRLTQLTGVTGLAPVHDIAVSADGRNVYAAVAADCDFDCRGKVLVFTRDAQTGELTQQDGAVDAEAQSLAISRDGRSVYTAGGLEIDSFHRDSTTGALTPGPVRCERAGDQPSCHGRGFGGGEGLPGIGIAVSSDGRNLYGASTWGESILAFTRSSARGSIRQLAGKLGCITAIPYDGCGRTPVLDFPDEVAVSPDGRLVLSGGALPISFVRDRSTGALSHGRNVWACGRRGQPLSCGQVGSVAFAPGGMAYISTVTGAVFGFRYDGRAHRLVQLRGPGSCAGPQKKGCVNTPAVHGWTRVAVSRDGRSVYEIGQRENITRLVRDTRSGRLSNAANVAISGIRGPTAIALSRDGRNAYVGASDGIAVFARR